MGSLFASDDDFEEAAKMAYIEKCCSAAEAVINTASSEEVLFEMITKWNEPRIISYEMTILEREGMLSGEDDDGDLP